MLQRIQTVFLLLSLILMALFLFQPLLRFEATGFTDTMPGWDVRHYMFGYIYFVNAIFTGTAMLFTLINIFMFKKRPVQMMLCWFSVVFLLSAVGFVYYKYQTKVFFGDVIFTGWNLLAVAAMLFQIAAFIYIRKDELLIKSLDRLR